MILFRGSNDHLRVPIQARSPRQQIPIIFPAFFSHSGGNRRGVKERTERSAVEGRTRIFGRFRMKFRNFLFLLFQGVVKRKFVGKRKNFRWETGWNFNPRLGSLEPRTRKTERDQGSGSGESIEILIPFLPVSARISPSSLPLSSDFLTC